MTRGLRPRKPRPSYASLIESDDEPIPDNDGDSASDNFQPGDNQEENEDMEIDAPDEEISEVEVIQPTEEESRPNETKKVKKASANKSSPITTKRARVSTRASKPTVRTSNTGTAQSMDSRQRADPIYYRSARVERLTQPPSPFKPSVTTSTNNWNSSKLCADRYSKACGYIIGGGPVWQLMEDRSWWKESLPVEEGKMETDATRRPRVYESVKVGSDVRIISNEYVYVAFSTLECLIGYTVKQKYIYQRQSMLQVRQLVPL